MEHNPTPVKSFYDTETKGIGHHEMLRSVRILEYSDSSYIFVSHRGEKCFAELLAHDFAKSLQHLRLWSQTLRAV